MTNELISFAPSNCEGKVHTKIEQNLRTLIQDNICENTNMRCVVQSEVEVVLQMQSLMEVGSCSKFLTLSLRAKLFRSYGPRKYFKVKSKLPATAISRSIVWCGIYMDKEHRLLFNSLIIDQAWTFKYL
jgi:hypothetical protein